MMESAIRAGRSRDRLLRHVSEPLAGALLVLFAEAALGSLLWITLVLYLITATVFSQGTEAAQSVMMILGLVIALGLARGAFTGIRPGPHAAILFQRPVSTRTHLFHTIRLRAILLNLLQLCGGVLLLLLTVPRGVPIGTVAGMIFGCWIWSTVLFCVAIGISALVDRLHTEWTIALFITSVLQLALLDLLPGPAVLRWVIGLLAMPIDGIFMIWEGALHGQIEIGAADLAHLSGYPLVWLGVAFISTRVRSTAI